MSTRWFFSSAQVGAAAVARGRALPTSVTFLRTIDGRRTPEVVPGPTLALVGPGDVLGFDRTVVAREEPGPGSAPAAENVLASIELVHADLPWLLSTGPVDTPSGPTPQPWLVLVVLEEQEAAPPRAGNPLPVLTAPVAALPPLAERWAWAHVEARLDDSVTDVAAASRLAEEGVRRHSPDVVARLLCPRQLRPDRGWIAAVVPATEAGRAAGLDREPAGPGDADAWRAGAGGTVELPVYHWWGFRTGPAGTFEELARRLRFRPAQDAGLGTRTVDVTRPWRPEPPGNPATVALDGALRVPGSTAVEVWSDHAAQQAFTTRARQRLDEPARRRGAAGAAGASGEGARTVAPPLYGSRFSGQPTVPQDPTSWLSTLNLEVRRRVAAALGARYVQVEQEFLMARAWEQAGEIRRANRMLAVTELATVAAARAQRKHLDPLAVADLVTVLAPASQRLPLSPAAAGPLDGPTTLAAALAASPVPTGTASSPFARLTRRGGAVARRAARGSSGDVVEAVSVVQQGLAEMGVLDEGDPASGLPGEVRAALVPEPLQLLRMADRIPGTALAGRSETAPRPLRPLLRHPRFTVPIAEEILARWPEWAIPGIGALPPDSVTLLETNPEFVAALLVGLNEEFNAELLWREFPTDQRGTAFARFWPTDGDDLEIARWPVETALGSQLATDDEGSLALLVRGELLRRFPGTALVAVRGEDGKLPTVFTGVPATPLALDESTVLYLLAGIGRQRAIDEEWFFVFREPMRGTQFGFDSGPLPVPVRTWADLTWLGVPIDDGRFVRLTSPPRTPVQLSPTDPPVWGRDAADLARIAYQQPFQLAFEAASLLGR